MGPSLIHKGDRPAPGTFEKRSVHRDRSPKGGPFRMRLFNH